jgi:hypothetical protein
MFDGFGLAPVTVPEPSAAVGLIAAGSLALVRRRRSRMR